MALREFFITFIWIFQTLAHYICYAVFIAIYQMLHIVEMACWTIDINIEHILDAQGGHQHATIPGYIKLANRLMRGVWRALMRANVYIHVSHSTFCNSNLHELPYDVTLFVSYFQDHPAGPNADHNIN